MNQKYKIGQIITDVLDPVLKYEILAIEKGDMEPLYICRCWSKYGDHGIKKISESFLSDLLDTTPRFSRTWNRFHMNDGHI